MTDLAVSGSVLHPFWGEIVYGETLPHTVRTYSVRGFEGAVPVQFDTASQVKEILTDEMLDEYAATFQHLLRLARAKSDELLPVVRQGCFGFYERVYGEFYEDAKLSGEAALGLTTPELHFEKMRTIEAITVGPKQSVVLQFDYLVDQEQDLEVMFLNGRFHEVGNALETRIPEDEEPVDQAAPDLTAANEAGKDDTLTDV